MRLLTHFFSVKLYVDFTLTRRFSAESSAGWVRARLRGGRVRSESGECECHEDISYNPASGDTGDTVSVLASEGGNLVWLCFNVYKVIFMDNWGDAWCHLLDGFTLIKTHDMTLNNSCSKLKTKESLQSAVSPKDSKILDFDFFHNISMQVCYSLLQDQSSAKLIVCWHLLTVSSHAQLFCWWVPEHKTVFQLSVQIWLPGKNGEQKNLCSLWRSFIAGQQRSHSFIASCPRGPDVRCHIISSLNFVSCKEKSECKTLVSKKVGRLFSEIFLSKYRVF